MRTLMVAAVGVWIAFGAFSSSAGASRAAVVAGSGTATFPGCPVGSDAIVPILGVQTAASWSFLVGDINATPTASCAIAAVGTYQGPSYTIAGGGCLPGVATGIILCLGGFVAPGPATVTLFLCTVVAGCVAGSATLMGTEA